MTDENSLAAALASGWKIETRNNTPPRGPAPVPAPTGDKYGAVPDSMKQVRRWLCWSYQIRGGRRTKVPFSPGGGPASSTDSTTWRTFEEVAAAEQFYSGIGFALGGGWLGIDWDDVRDPATGAWLPGILEEILSLKSYAEISPSGRGAHVICHGKKPGDLCRKSSGPREIYDSGRFFTITGIHIDGTPEEVKEPPAGALELVYAKISTEAKTAPTRSCLPAPCARVDLDDDEIISLCGRASNSAKFATLWSGNTAGYGSASEADLALSAILGFYTRDSAQIERLVKQSGLYRVKHDRDDYMARTIATALAGVRETYTPPFKSLSPEEQYQRRVQHRRRMRAMQEVRA